MRWKRTSGIPLPSQFIRCLFLVASQNWVQIIKLFRNYHQSRSWLIELGSQIKKFQNKTRWNSQLDCCDSYIRTTSSFLDRFQIDSFTLRERELQIALFSQSSGISQDQTRVSSPSNASQSFYHFLLQDIPRVHPIPLLANFVTLSFQQLPEVPYKLLSIPFPIHKFSSAASLRKERSSNL